MIEVLKSIEGEGRLFGLPLSYAYYMIYLSMACLFVFMILHNAGIVRGISVLLVVIIPIILYVIFRIKAKRSNKRMQLESWIAYRLTPKIFKSQKIIINDKFHKKATARKQ